jgi:transposase
VGATQVTVGCDQQWRNRYLHMALRRGSKLAKVAMAQRLAVRTYWMWHQGRDYEQMKKFGRTRDPEIAAEAESLPYPQ